MQQDFKRDASMTKVKFPDYWDKGKPYLDGINHVFIPDTTSAKIAFESGQGQVLQLGDTKSARDLANKGFAVRAFDGLSNFLVGDSGNPNSPFSKLKVRQALSYAIDRKTICATVGSGYWKVTNQLIPVDFVGHNPGLPDLVFDPAKAKQLLTEAGYPEGFTTKIMGIQAFTNTDLVTALQANLKDVGIETTVDLMDFGRGFATQKNGWENGLMISGTGLDPNMIQRMAVDLGKGSYPTTARTANWYSLLDQAAAARDAQGRGQFLQQLMKETMDEMFVVPIFTVADMAALDKAVNCELLTYHHVKWNPASAWLDK
jgi:ABC-type transport system substrate-binding protein